VVTRRQLVARECAVEGVQDFVLGVVGDAGEGADCGPVGEYLEGVLGQMGFPGSLGAVYIEVVLVF